MIAAIYARRSTEQNVAEDAKSITRQVELARAFALKQGWTVADEHVYVDDGNQRGRVRGPGVEGVASSRPERTSPGSRTHRSSK